MEHKHITFGQLCTAFNKHNVETNIKSQFDDKNALKGVVVFKDEGANQGYSLESRSYRFSSDNKFFISGMHGSSIYARNLDNTDSIRLDWYLGDSLWKVDYCYIESEEKSR